MIQAIDRRIDNLEIMAGLQNNEEFINIDDEINEIQEALINPQFLASVAAESRAKENIGVKIVHQPSDLKLASIGTLRDECDCGSTQQQVLERIKGSMQAYQNKEDKSTSIKVDVKTVNDRHLQLRFCSVVKDVLQTPEAIVDFAAFAKCLAQRLNEKLVAGTWDCGIAYVGSSAQSNPDTHACLFFKMFFGRYCIWAIETAVTQRETTSINTLFNN